MSKRITIIIGLSIILVLLGIWGYILVYGTPEQVEEVFATFSRSDEHTIVDTTPQELPTEEQGQDNDLFTTSDSPQQTTPGDQPALRQITTDPVAGFQLTTRQSSSATTTPNIILYAEAGTGHIYRHDPSTNLRDRLANFTISQAHSAYFTPDGNYGVVVSGFDTEQLLHIFNLHEIGTTTEPEIININARNIAVGQDNTLLYTVADGIQTRGLVYDFSTGTDRQLFTTPLTQVKVAWGTTAEDIHYLYPRPAAGLMSQVFVVEGTNVRRTPIQGYNLAVLYNNNVLAYSFDAEANPPTNTGRIRPVERLSYATHSNNLGQRAFLNLIATENTCAIATYETVVCARPIVDDIIAGEERRGMRRTNRNFLFTEQLDHDSAQSLINLEQASGRAIDVATLNLYETPHGDTILMTNQVDGTLWLYDIP